jgi:hypothetical protein
VTCAVFCVGTHIAFENNMRCGSILIEGVRVAPSVKPSNMRYPSHLQPQILNGSRFGNSLPLRIPQLAPPSSLIVPIPDWLSSSRLMCEILFATTCRLKAWGDLLIFLHSSDPPVLKHLLCDKFRTVRHSLGVPTRKFGGECVNLYIRKVKCELSRKIKQAVFTGA